MNRSNVDIDEELRRLRAAIDPIRAERDARFERYAKTHKGWPQRLPPRGQVPEPWPSWLSKNLINENFLKMDPFELREELFAYRGDYEYPDIVDNLLFGIEVEARKALKDEDNPPPFNGLINKSKYFDELTEDKFCELFGRCNEFTPKQANAVAVLRSILILRALTSRVCHGDYFHDPERTYDHYVVARIVMETVVLVAACFRGEFFNDHVPVLKRSAEQKQRLQRISLAGVEKRKSRSQKLADLCRSIAEKSARPTVRGRALFVQQHLKKKYRRCPSLRTIQTWIG